MLFNRTLLVFLIIAVFVAACSDDENGVQDPDAGPGADVEEDVEEDVYDGPPGDPLATCDDLNPGVCAFPWPSNLYLSSDEETATGYRLKFDEETLPANQQGIHVRPQLFEHLDGYDLGVPIMVKFPELDDSDLPGEYEIEDSMAGDAQILLYEVSGESLERIPYWAELDALEDDAESQTLFIRPAVILENNTRYIVALRDLETTAGEPIEPSESFAALVAGDAGGDPVLAHRQERFDDVFNLLEGDGISPDDVTLAWDFVTASSDALHQPMLQIRDDAFAFADEEGVDWSVEDVFFHHSDDPDDDDYDPYIGMTVEAVMEVPHYMEPYDGISDAWKLSRDEDGQIQRVGEPRQVPVLVRIPYRALEGEEVGLIVYGHGLLGGRWEIYADHLGQIAEQAGYVVVAVDLVGMAHTEGDAAQEAVQDLNHFIALSDRLHQGLLEYLLLARTAAEALVELEPGDEQLSIDPDDVHYMGGSQGGIFGATFMALTPDIERGYLAVPGNNYSTLLHRSVNFDDFNDFMTLTYRSSADRNLNIAAMSLMWSTTEPVSFLRHIRSEPFDGQPRDVLLAVAKGDWQVATITNENVARSDIDIPLMENYDSQRDPYGVQYAPYDHEGSGTVLFDFGNPWPDRANRPPQDEVGDPHGWLGSVEEALIQLDTFLREGVIVDICDGEPCQFDPP